MSDIEDKLDDLLRRGQAEVAGVDLFAPPPPNEDCPICFLPYPRFEGHAVFSACCGKMICGGCAHSLNLLGPEERGGPQHVCAFCRAPPPMCGPDRVRAVKRHMRKRNPRAFVIMSCAYQLGDGVPRDERKVFEMLARAADLGHADAYRLIGNYYNEGLTVAQDKSKCRAFFEIAAKKGSTISHHMLAGLHEEKGNVGLAIKHHTVAACAGLRPSLTPLMKAFMDGLLSKKEIEHCLRAFQASEDEVKSEGRDAFEAYRVSQGFSGF